MQVLGRARLMLRRSYETRSQLHQRHQSQNLIRAYETWVAHQTHFVHQSFLRFVGNDPEGSFLFEFSFEPRQRTCLKSGDKCHHCQRFLASDASNWGKSVPRRFARSRVVRTRRLSLWFFGTTSTMTKSRSVQSEVG
jgi:hypothetical protein